MQVKVSDTEIGVPALRDHFTFLFTSAIGKRILLMSRCAVRALATRNAVESEGKPLEDPT